MSEKYLGSSLNVSPDFAAFMGTAASGGWNKSSFCQSGECDEVLGSKQEASPVDSADLWRAKPDQPELLDIPAQGLPASELIAAA